MNSFYANSDSVLDFDPMLDLVAQEDESQAVADFHNGFLCTVDE